MAAYPTPTEQRLARLERAVVELVDCEARFKAVPFYLNPALAEIVRETRNGAREARPYVMPEQRDVVGIVR